MSRVADDFEVPSTVEDLQVVLDNVVGIDTVGEAWVDQAVDSFVAADCLHSQVDSRDPDFDQKEDKVTVHVTSLPAILGEKNME